MRDKIYRLWQWRRATCEGKDNILAKARHECLIAFSDALNTVANNYIQSIANIKDATDYYCSNETGSVSCYIVDVDEHDNIILWERELYPYRRDDGYDVHWSVEPG